MTYFNAPIGVIKDRVRNHWRKSVSVALSGALLVTAFAVSSAQAQQGHWTAYFSDSTDQTSALCEKGISGMRVHGTWAANNSLFCRLDDTGILASPDIPFKPVISEELPNNAVQCPPNEVVVGMKCSELYCDKVALQCAPIDRKRFTVTNSCWWSSSISDSTITSYTAGSGLLTGMRCEGGYCVNKSLRFCGVEKVEPKEGDKQLNARWEPVCTGGGTCIASVDKSFRASNEAEEAISQTTTASLATSIEAGDGLFTNASISASLTTERNIASSILRARSTGNDSGCKHEVTPRAGTSLVWRRVYQGTIQGYPVTLASCLVTCTKTKTPPNYSPGDPEGINACGNNTSNRNLTSVSTTPTSTGGISVTSATYGANCLAPAGNATAQVASQCNGKSDCAYQVHVGYLGDPAPSCAKNYRVEYNCSNGLQGQSAAVTSEAGLGSVVKLTCAARSTAVPATKARTIIGIGTATYGANCGAPAGNASDALRKACSEQGSCDYVVDFKLLGDPAPGCSKDFDIEYWCGQSNNNNIRFKKAKVAAEAHGKSAAMNCFD